jgi:hypothetical protein
MSVVSKSRKVKLRPTVRQLKLVQSVTRRGADTITTEEVKTPRQERQKGPSSSRTKESSSPMKRPKLEGWDAKPVQCDFQGADEDGKRQTMVFILP